MLNFVFFNIKSCLEYCILQQNFPAKSWQKIYSGHDPDPEPGLEMNWKSDPYPDKTIRSHNTAALKYLNIYLFRLDGLPLPGDVTQETSRK
jgi:hypothetical protein